MDHLLSLVRLLLLVHLLFLFHGFFDFLLLVSRGNGILYISLLYAQLVLVISTYVYSVWCCRSLFILVFQFLFYLPFHQIDSLLGWSWRPSMLSLEHRGYHDQHFFGWNTGLTLEQSRADLLFRLKQCVFLSISNSAWGKLAKAWNFGWLGLQMAPTVASKSISTWPWHYSRR